MVEFNNGFVTALGLFHGHSMDGMLKTSPELVLYGASDHLYDIEYPSNISDELKEKIGSFVDYVFTFRMRHDTTREEVFEVFEACRKLLVKIDEELFGLTVELHYS